MLRALLSMLSAIVGIPFLVCTVGGSISIIWLLILGEWLLAIVGFFCALIIEYIIKFLNNLIVSPLFVFSLRIMKKSITLGVPICFIAVTISFSISYIWISLITNQILIRVHGNILPYILFAFSMGMSPFIDKKKFNNPIIAIHIISVLIGASILYVTILLHNFTDMSFWTGENYMLYVLLLGAISQCIIAVLIIRNGKKKEKFNNENSR